jgi:hypothetical protein
VRTRANHISCGIALPYRAKDPRFVKIENYAPHFQGHLFRVASAADLDDQIQRWLRDAYRVGSQEFLKKRRPKKAAS